jgi:hypothetical protein
MKKRVIVIIGIGILSQSISNGYRSVVYGTSVIMTTPVFLTEK